MPKFVASSLATLFVCGILLDRKKVGRIGGLQLIRQGVGFGCPVLGRCL